MKKFLSRFTCFCLLIVFIGSGFLLLRNIKEEYQFHQLEEQIVEEKQMLVEEEYEFTGLIEINKDTIGWISIPGTLIDYPIVQASNNSYYLTHDCNQEESKYGCIFMDYRNAAYFSDSHTIVYGHNMKNGSMFHDLNEYSNQDFFDKHPYIETFCPTGYYKWEVFSTYSTEPDFNYLQTAFDSPNEFFDFLNKLVTKSQFCKEEIQITAEDKVLTLSTCSNDFENGRRVVHAKLVEEVIDDE